MLDIKKSVVSFQIYASIAVLEPKMTHQKARKIYYTYCQTSFGSHILSNLPMKGKKFPDKKIIDFNNVQHVANNKI